MFRILIPHEFNNKWLQQFMVNKAKKSIVQQKLNKTTPNYEHYQLRFQTNKYDTQKKRKKKRNETQAATREKSVYHREEVQAKQQQLAAAPNLVSCIFILGLYQFFFFIHLLLCVFTYEIEWMQFQFLFFFLIHYFENWRVKRILYCGIFSFLKIIFFLYIYIFQCNYYIHGTDLTNNKNNNNNKKKKKPLIPVPFESNWQDTHSFHIVYNKKKIVL